MQQASCLEGGPLLWIWPLYLHVNQKSDDDDDDDDHVTNEEVRRKIQAAIGEYDELLTLVKKRKLRWFGHVSRSSGLAKTILQGTVKGKRKRGRQKKRWEDNIKEWTGMDLASSIRAAENRSKWKGIVANSSVVPRRPPKVME